MSRVRSARHRREHIDFGRCVCFDIFTINSDAEVIHAFKRGNVDNVVNARRATPVRYSGARRTSGTRCSVVKLYIDE